MLLLSRFTVLRTSNPEQTFESIRSRQPGVYNFEPPRVCENWRMKVNFLSLGRVGVTSTRSSAYSLSSAPDGLVRVWVATGTAFKLDLGHTSRIFPSGAIGWMPVFDYRAHFQDDFGTLLVTIPRDDLRAALHALTGRPDIARLDDPALAENCDLEFFRRQLYHTVTALSEIPSGILEEGSFKRAHQELLILSLAHAIAASADSTEPSKAKSGYVARALDYVRESLTDEISLSALADYAGCSLRTLQIAFKKELQKTITGYIRDERLNLAWRRLTAPSPGDSVTSIALACGFAHLGEFSHHYFLRFGEKPSETLSGRRRR